MTYKDDDAERTCREQQVDPVFNLCDLHVVAGRNHTSLVQTTVELYDNLSGSVIVDNFELANVACINALRQ